MKGRFARTSDLDWAALRSKVGAEIIDDLGEVENVGCERWHLKIGRPQSR